MLSVHWNSIVAMQLSPDSIDHPGFLSAVFNLVPKDFQPDSEKPWGWGCGIVYNKISYLGIHFSLSLSEQSLLKWSVFIYIKFGFWWDSKTRGTLGKTFQTRVENHQIQPKCGVKHRMNWGHIGERQVFLPLGQCSILKWIGFMFNVSSSFSSLCEISWHQWMWMPFAIHHALV